MSLVKARKCDYVTTEMETFLKRTQIGIPPSPFELNCGKTFPRDQKTKSRTDDSSRRRRV